MKRTPPFFSIFLLSILFWLLPFLYRLYIKVPIISLPSEQYQKNTPTVKQYTEQLLKNGNKQGLFIMIFKNNIKGCVINILGGVFLGLGTIFNLIYNGFFSADVFVNSYQSGISIASILKVTLPHSFELLGFWLSGAIGFYIAWNIIQFMRGKDTFTKKFYKSVGIGSLSVFVIILTAAYVEAYISILFVS